MFKVVDIQATQLRPVKCEENGVKWIEHHVKKNKYCLLPKTVLKKKEQWKWYCL